MQSEVIAQLLALNELFYQTLARPFAQTRQRLQPGVRRLLPLLLQQASLLDLGCGSGELARALAREGFRGHYTGLDFSPALLDFSRQGMPDTFDVRFVQADLAQPGWEVLLPRQNYAAILAFAVLHHLPGESLRCRIVEQARRLLAEGGLFIHSNWQFLHSPRLKARLQPWSRIGLEEMQVEPGDYLLDWRQGGTGLRYVHYFDEAELARLAAQTHFRIREVFYADGRSGNLGLYMVWEAV